MTFRAACSIAAEVNVVLAMALNAFGADADLALNRCLVAAEAAGSSVDAFELETRGAIVIECELLPRFRLVTLSTARPKALLVDIVFRVAGDAFAAGILEGPRHVAELALDFGMTARERKP